MSLLGTAVATRPLRRPEAVRAVAFRKWLFNQQMQGTASHRWQPLEL